MDENKKTPGGFRTLADKQSEPKPEPEMKPVVAPRSLQNKVAHDKAKSAKAEQTQDIERSDEVEINTYDDEAAENIHEDVPNSALFDEQPTEVIPPVERETVPFEDEPSASDDVHEGNDEAPDKAFEPTSEPMQGEHSETAAEPYKVEPAEHESPNYKMIARILIAVAAVLLIAIIGVSVFACTQMNNQPVEAEQQEVIESEPVQQPDEVEVVTPDAEEAANATQSETTQAAQESDDETEDDTVWSTRYVLIHHKAKTHTVKHPATYEEVVEYHTICNTCGEQIDGQTDEHAKKTGHEGYTTDSPVKVKKVKTEAYTETVTDQEAYDELVEDGQVSDSGEVRNNTYNDDGTKK